MTQQLTLAQTTFTDPEFEALFQKLEMEQPALAKIQAKQDGLTNSPMSKEHFWVQTLNPLKATFQKVLDINYARFQPVSDVAVIQNTRKTAEEKVHELTGELTEQSKKLELLQQEKEHLKKSIRPGMTSWKRRIIPFLFGITEGYLVFDMFSDSSLSFFVCLIWGILAALITGVGLHLGANYISKAATERQKKWRTAQIVLSALALSVVLGTWRANNYSNSSSVNSEVDLGSTASTVTHYSPWPFIIFSFAAFIVGLFLEIKYWISEEEKNRMKRYEEKCKEVKAAEQRVQEITKQIDEVKASAAYDSALIMRKQEYACGNEHRLMSLAREVLNIYESTNVEFRKDRLCPPYFGQQYDFGFSLYFIPLFNTIKQTA